MKILVAGPDGEIALLDAAKLKGLDGARGADGLSGSDGKDGAQGPIGLQGPPGESIAGPPGKDGRDGIGISGPAGRDGESIVGPKGDKGDPGKDGRDGKDGAEGPVGPVGPQGPAGRDAELPTGASSGDFLTFGPNGIVWSKAPQQQIGGGGGPRLKFNRINDRLDALEQGGGGGGVSSAYVNSFYALKSDVASMFAAFSGGGGGVNSAWVIDNFQPIGDYALNSALATYATSVHVSSGFAHLAGTKADSADLATYATSAHVSSGFGNLSTTKAASADYALTSALATYATSAHVSSIAATIIPFSQMMRNISIGV
jgi:hypothetical protein